MSDRSSRRSSPEAEWPALYSFSSNLNSEPRKWCWLFTKHLVAGCLTLLIVTLLVLGFLSGMGMGQVAIDTLEEQHAWVTPMAGTSIAILVVLFLLDFFKPPHMPGTFFRLWKHDVYIGRGLFSIAIMCALSACLLMTKHFPSVPLVMTILLLPAVLFLVRCLLVRRDEGLTAGHPKGSFFKESSRGPRFPDPSDHDGMEPQESLATANSLNSHSRSMARESADGEMFVWFQALFVSLILAASMTLASWMVWVVKFNHELPSLEVCVDGWHKPVECASRFMHDDVEYTHCVPPVNDGGKAWCSTTYQLKGPWTYCVRCEESVDTVFYPSNASCLGSDLAMQGSLTTTVAECQQLCQHNSTCSYAVYFSPACRLPSCLSGSGSDAVRCGLASSSACDGAASSDLAVNGSRVETFRREVVTIGRISESDREVRYILWSTPLVLAISMFVIAAFTGLRLVLHRTYITTLVSEEDLNLYIASMTGCSDTQASALRKRAREVQVRNLKRLALFVKLGVSLLVIMLGLLWVGVQLLYADSQVALMCLGLFGCYLLIFIAWNAMSLQRVMDHLWDWLVQLPIWRTCASMLRSDWSRVAILIVLLPGLPTVLLLSFLQQYVRLRRGIYGSYSLRQVAPMGVVPTSPADDETAAAETEPQCKPHASVESNGRPKLALHELWFTPSVHNALRAVLKWDWLSLTKKAYVLSAVFLAYTLCPVCLNVFLSWFNSFLLEAHLNFEIIVVITFFTGTAAFLLPPVPGLTVYIFGGLMLSATCPGENGFWYGALVNIFLGWFLKLFACAIQQVVLGGLLGKSLYIRRTVGVHRLAIRCIEGVLREPGMSFGKIAILCGGPDWPVSVLAGILNLSVVQCELGTLPIIFFIVPCSLSGSFYLKKGTSDMWDRSADLMIIVSVTVNLFLWALVAWAMQRYLAEHYDELTRPLPQNVDLEWLDFRASELRKEARVTWSSVPPLVRGMYSTGAVVQVLIGHILWWGYSALFNHFEVSDTFSELDSWYGDKGIVNSSGLAAMLVFAAMWVLYLQFAVWAWCKTRGCLSAKRIELSQVEAAWKEEWVKKAQAWTPTRSNLPEGVPEDDAPTTAPDG